MTACQQDDGTLVVPPRANIVVRKKIRVAFPTNAHVSERADTVRRLPQSCARSGSPNQKTSIRVGCKANTTFSKSLALLAQSLEFHQGVAIH